MVEVWREGVGRALLEVEEFVPLLVFPSTIFSEIFVRDGSLLTSLRLNMPLIRDVMVGFLGGSKDATPFPLTWGAGFFEGGREKLPSGCECTEELVDAEGTGEATGFEEVTAGVFSVDDIFDSGSR